MLPLRDNVPRRKKPVATGIIIIINILVYLYQTQLPRQELMFFVREFGLVPSNFLSTPVNLIYTPLTSMFLHGGLGHIIGNMWILALFGDNVEDRMGRLSFVFFYLLSGLAASAAHMAFNLDSVVPIIGASGAIAGVMAAYVFLFPLARVITLIPIFFFPYIISLPAMIFMGAWFLIQIYYGTLNIALGGAAGGIAWWAHIGGFVFGGVVYRFFLKNKLQYY